MSINLQQPIVQALALQMMSGRTRLIGIPKERIQVIMTLPDILEFNEDLFEAIEFFKDRAEAFIITSSNIQTCQDVIDQYQLRDNIISTQFKEFAKLFSMYDHHKNLKKSLMIIDTNCQITHKDVL